jgi:hypothetical protein
MALSTAQNFGGMRSCWGKKQRNFYLQSKLFVCSAVGQAGSFSHWRFSSSICRGVITVSEIGDWFQERGRSLPELDSRSYSILQCSEFVSIIIPSCLRSLNIRIFKMARSGRSYLHLVLTRFVKSISRDDVAKKLCLEYSSSLWQRLIQLNVKMAKHRSELLGEGMECCIGHLPVCRRTGSTVET